MTFDLRRSSFSDVAPAISEEEFDQLTATGAPPTPEPLRELYRLANGATPALPYYRSKKDGREFGLRWTHPVRYRRFEGDILLEETLKWWLDHPVRFPSRLYPFGENEGGDIFCLDLETEHVVFFDMEEEGEFAVIDVADPLLEFFDGMQSAEDFGAVW